jgi:hypothetical protein
MYRLRTILIVILTLVLVVAAHAQSPRFTVSSNVSPDQVRALLESSSPNRVAWGAYFASRNNDEGAVTLMVQRVERWTPTDASSYENMAMSEVLYSLIERDEVVPPEAISAVASTFPIQATILASRLPIEDATPLLQDWYETGKDVDVDLPRWDLPRWDPRPFLASFAAMMLVKAPPSGFVASLRVELKKRELLSETNKNPWYSISNQDSAKGGKCEDETAPTLSEEWPPLFQYALEENSPSSQDAAVLVEEDDGDRITWRREPAGVRLSGCYSPHALTIENLRRLLAEIPDGNK